jgi:hypothetical protein
MRMFCLAFFIGCQLLAAVAYGQRVIGVPVVDVGRGHQLIGKLHKPLGTVVRIQGVVVEGPFKGYEGGPNIRVQRINGEATQEDIQIRLDDTTKAVGPVIYKKLELKRGEFYEFEGFESGGFVGHPRELWKSENGDGEFGLPWIQTTNYHFTVQFHFVRFKSIEPLKDTPDDFIGQRALLEGIARDEDGQAIMEGNGWIVIVNSKAPWLKG